MIVCCLSSPYARLSRTASSDGCQSLMEGRHITMRHRLRIASVLALLTSFVVATPDVAHASITDGPIGRSEILARAQYWVDAGIAYDMYGDWFRDPEGDKNYRRDCSGLVSMAWHLGDS